jgi:hypothetical protein
MLSLNHANAAKVVTVAHAAILKVVAVITVALVATNYCLLLL